MSNLMKDLTEEIVGAFSLGIMAIIFIIILSAFGKVSGQNELVNSAIKGILLIVFGIGIPIGIISLIKLFGGLSNERFY